MAFAESPLRGWTFLVGFGLTERANAAGANSRAACASANPCRALPGLCLPLTALASSSSSAAVFLTTLVDHMPRRTVMKSCHSFADMPFEPWVGFPDLRGHCRRRGLHDDQDGFHLLEFCPLVIGLLLKSGDLFLAAGLFNRRLFGPGRDGLVLFISTPRRKYVRRSHGVRGLY